MVEKYKEGIGGVHGNHPDYTREINSYIKNKYDDYVNDGLSEMLIARRLHADLNEIIRTLQGSIIENSINSTTKINELPINQILR
jgi:hypothetical protein